MKTKLYDMTKEIDPAKLKEVAQLLKQGELVAFPTETVYGLGADARQEIAVRNIFTAKGRPSDNPLIVHVATKEQLFSLVKNVPDYVEQLIDRFSPGPITYVLPSNQKVAPTVTANLATVGVRIPDHPVALALLQEVNLPIAAPSANRSGRPSPTEASHVLEDLSGRIKAIVDGGRTDVGIESTVLHCTGAIPGILRPGWMKAKDIKEVVGDCHVYQAKESPQEPKSPGMKYTHYAPEVPLFLVKKDKLKETLSHYQREGKRVALLYESDSLAKEEATVVQQVAEAEFEIGRRLYRLLRSFTKAEVDLILWEYPSVTKEAAIVDRLERAATKIIR